MNAPDDLDLIEQLLARQPVETMHRLAHRYFSNSALRNSRLDERDAAYRDLAVDLHQSSGYAIGQTIGAEVERYRRGAWRFDRGRAPPADPRRALAHRILTLDDGRVRSRWTIERALAGVRAKSPAQKHEHLPDASPDEPGERNEGCAAVEGFHRAAG